MNKQPIAVFDSGYGGLTVLKEITALLPQYDYLYLGDNSRAPYGNKSYATVYEYTLEAVKWFFAKGCPLVILACNTASAKALRTIQQNDLPKIASQKRVLGVIRPTAEVIGNFSQTGHVGVMGTTGTVESSSYILEIQKKFPQLSVTQEACPLWVPIIENNEQHSPEAENIIEKNVKNLLHKDDQIDTILLACTHYPLIAGQILKYTPKNVQLISQGKIVAESLLSYLQRQQQIEQQCSKNQQLEFYTTGDVKDFDSHATLFYGQPVAAKHTDLKL